MDATKSTAETWRDRLLDELNQRRASIATAEAYYEGDHPLPAPPDRMNAYQQAARAFTSLSRMGVTNYVKLVADAPSERLKVIGFRFGETFDADADAWRIWQANSLDADSNVLQHSAIVVGTAFALVWPGAGTDGPTITVEHASQAIVAYAPGSRRQRAAGLKWWTEDDGSERVVLYLPAEVHKWQRRAPTADFETWQPATDESWPIVNPSGVVPLVEFRCNPTLGPAPFGGGRSDFAAVISIQDRINKTVFDRLVTAEFQAFRQRWAVGWTPDDPNEAIKASMSNLMSFDDGDVKLGEFSQADFRGFIDSCESDVRAMAAITRTPFYSLGQLANPPSGEALQALQAGLVARTEAHRDNFSEAWEEVMRLALDAADDPKATDTQSQIVWRDIEHRTWAETSDALVKMVALGVPREALWSMIPNTTPQDINRWKVMVADEELFAPQAPTVANA